MESSKTLYIDSKDFHLDSNNAITIHPKQISMVSVFKKDSFDKIIILNSEAPDLKAMAFFYLSQALKDDGTIEITVDQPISVMVDADVKEIEASARRGGFNTISVETNEETVMKMKKMKK